MKKAILAIRIIGDPCLRAVSIDLEEVGPGERILMQAMIETMRQADGVGLAAPQVGVNKRIIVVDVGEGPIVLVNPKIVNMKGISILEEGCLSVPKGCVKVERPEIISVRFLDAMGRQQEMECSGLLSRAIQHECDHLDGKLIVDYADSEEKKNLKQLFPEVQL
jgi:peptide deformylase